MKRSFTTILIISALFILATEILRPEYTSSQVQNTMIQTLITRTLGGVLFLFLIKGSSQNVFGISISASALISVLVALAVALNNAPIIGLVTGNARVDAGAFDLVLFAMQAFAVALFEEAAFRGYLFPFILERFSERSVFFSTVLSSAVFAAFHLVNIFYGAPGSVLLQVGYTFLIGGMCAVVLLKTRCLWICVGLHAIYNFGGTLVPTLGSGIVWDTLTVTITAILGAAALAIMLLILSKVTKEEAAALYTKQK